MDCDCASRPLLNLSVQTFPNVCPPAACMFSQHEVLLGFVSRNSSSNFIGWSFCLGEQDSFWIRNEFQILSYCSAPDLGSAYGNQPYRSFREQTVPSPRAGDRDQRQHVCQHTLVGQRASQSYIRGGIDHGLLLWGRPGRWNLPVCSYHCASQCFSHSRLAYVFLLRGRPGRWNLSLCSGAECKGSHYRLVLVGRFSTRGGGQ